MKRILYIGIFSASNIGDLVISDQIYNYLLNKKNVSINCMDFTTLKKIEFDNEDISIYENDDTNSINRNVKKILSKNNIIKKCYNKYLDLLASNTNSELYENYKSIIDDYDLICIGGGNLLMSASNNCWAFKINNLVKIAKIKNKKIFIMSVGAGPILLNKSLKLYKETLELVDYITVRDEYSKQIIKNNLKINKKVETSGDPAILLKNKNRKKEKEKWNDIHIAISVMPFGKKNFLNLPYYKDYEYYMNMYQNLIEYFYKKNNNFIFHLFSTEFSDYSAILELQTHILDKSECITQNNLKVVYVKSLTDLLNFYKKQDLLIGTRMHSLIIGYTQSLPIIAISWQNKVEGFMKYVDLIQHCYQLNRVNENIDRIYDDAQQLLVYNLQIDNIKLINMKNRYDHVNSHYIDAIVD
jgi:polysaccharide pyruvyl transferase WcaK-like protein